MDMTGQTVVITGASRGIGAAAAREFAQAGANLVLLARTETGIRQIGEEIGARALPLRCDVSSWAQVEAAVAQAVARFGGIDVLVNNAGVIEPVAMLRDSDPAGWTGSIDVNLKGVYHGMRAVLPVMRAAGGGTVLTVSSGAAHDARAGWSHYCTAKAGVHMLTMALDVEEAEAGIRAIGLSPGAVATDMQRDIKAAGLGPTAGMDWSEFIPPEWPAKALLWMCSSEADAFLGKEVRLSDPAIRARIGVGQ